MSDVNTAYRLKMSQSTNASAIAVIPASTNVVPCASNQNGKRGPRGGIYDPFPIKFHRALDQIRDEGMDSIVSWVSHGRAFKIHKPKVFAAIIMPRFFNQSKYTSFQRQLNLYGFCRCYQGPDNGSYYHPLFLRGKPSLAMNIVRIKIKGCGHKTMKLYDSEPDFYAMPPLGDCSEESDCSSFSRRSRQTMEQPKICDSSAGFASHQPSHQSPPHPSEVSTITKNGFPRLISMDDQLCRQPSSVSEGGNSSNSSSSDFVTRLNQTIFVHELAMVCTALCSLRKDKSL